MASHTLSRVLSHRMHAVSFVCRAGRGGIECSCRSDGPMASVCKTGGEKQSGLQDHPPLLTVVCMSSSLYASLFACGGEFYLTILGNPLSCLNCMYSVVAVWGRV